LVPCSSCYLSLLQLHFVNNSCLSAMSSISTFCNLIYLLIFVYLSAVLPSMLLILFNLYSLANLPVIFPSLHFLKIPFWQESSSSSIFCLDTISYLRSLHTHEFPHLSSIISNSLCFHLKPRSYLCVWHLTSKLKLNSSERI